MATTANKDYNGNFLTLKQMLMMDGVPQPAQKQFKWLQKKFVEADSSCGCKKGYYKYLVTEDAHGNKLDSAQWFDDVYVFEDPVLRPAVTRDRWNELRGDYFQEDSADELLPHERTPGKNMTDRNGFVTVNEGYTQFPAK